MVLLSVITRPWKMRPRETCSHVLLKLCWCVGSCAILGSQHGKVQLAFVTWCSVWWDRCFLERIMFMQCTDQSRVCSQPHLGRACLVTPDMLHNAKFSVLKKDERTSRSTVPLYSSCKLLRPNVVPQRGSINERPSSELPEQLFENLVGRSSTLCSTARLSHGRYKLLVPHWSQLFRSVPLDQQKSWP